MATANSIYAFSKRGEFDTKTFSKPTLPLFFVGANHHILRLSFIIQMQHQCSEKWNSLNGLMKEWLAKRFARENITHVDKICHGRLHFL